MLDFVKIFFSKAWEFFSIKWPGFDFSIGTVFLATAASLGSLTMIYKMIGVGAVSSAFGVARRGLQYSKGGNNRSIKVSDERKNDRK